jgi:hypothetical protein
MCICPLNKKPHDALIKILAQLAMGVANLDTVKEAGQPNSVSRLFFAGLPIGEMREMVVVIGCSVGVPSNLAITKTPPGRSCGGV